MNLKKIAIGADHTGFHKKALIIDLLKKTGYEVKDFGCFSTESMDYPDAAHPVATAVENGEFEKGILLCGTANGVVITANKHQDIRAGLAWTPEIATLIRQHNDANIVCIPSRFTTDVAMLEIVYNFLNTEFEGGRHAARVEKIALS